MALDAAVAAVIRLDSAATRRRTSRRQATRVRGPRPTSVARPPIELSGT